MMGGHRKCYLNIPLLLQLVVESSQTEQTVCKCQTGTYIFVSESRHFKNVTKNYDKYTVLCITLQYLIHVLLNT